IQIGEPGKRSVRRQQIKSVERVRLPAKCGPQIAGVVASIVVQHPSAPIKPLFESDRAHAKTTDLFDTALFNQPREEIKKARRVRLVFWDRARNYIDRTAKLENLIENAGHPFFCAKIEI